MSKTRPSRIKSRDARSSSSSWFYFPKNKQGGVALLTALFAIMIIWYMVIEVVHDASVEFNVNSGRVHEVQAYYAAKAGVEISLLRVQLYQKIMAQFGDQIEQNPQFAQMVEPLWNFPFVWPPVLPDEISTVDRGMIERAAENSLMEASYMVTIEDEGSKIDINDLASPSQALSEITKQQLLNIFENRMRNDQDWANENRNLDYQSIINNLIDWIDEDQQSLNGGAEQAHYGQLDVQDFPPNRAFRTLGEVRLVAGMTDEVFKMLEPRITVHGMKAINPNYAPREVLMSLSPEMTEEIVARVIERRQDKLQGPFKNREEFVQFLAQEGITLIGEDSPEATGKIPLVFHKLYNFRIKSNGQAGHSSQEITAITYDLESVAKSLAELVKQENPEEGAPTPPPGEDPPGPRSRTGNNPSPDQNSTPKGRPRIVYWSHSQ